MSLQLMFSYKVAFKENIHNILELTKEIPSPVIIYYFSMINSRIQRDSDEKVFAFATRRWPDSNKNYLINAKAKYEKSNKAIATYFSEWIVTEYIKYEMLNYREFEYNFPNTTIEHEINLYLAYLKMVDMVLDREEIKYPQNDKFNFQELIWPMGIYQFEFVNYTPPIFDAIRIEVFLWSLKQNDTYAPYVDAYVAKFNVETSWALISLYINVMKWIVEKKEQLGEFFFLTLKPGDIHTALFESNLFNVDEYQSSPEKQKYFIGLKEKPLFRYGDVYLILNSKFLLNKIYNGILFDFFKTSGISNLFNNNFGNFKSIQSFAISEKILFRKAIRLLFDRRRFTTVFPENDNIVDGYVRDGKYIYLFEFKDSSLALSAIDSRNYNEFENNLKRNFVESDRGKPKGVNQVLNTIKQIVNAPFDFDNFNKKGIKTRNVVIYPIIIYTDSYYSMYGVNEYLERKFNENIDFTVSGSIKPLTMISLNFLLQYGELIERGGLKGIIDKFHRWRKGIETKMHKNPDPNESFKIYSSIEHSPGSEILNHSKDYTVKFINDFLEHLPKN